MAEYNRLLPFVIAEFGTEAEQLFQPIDLGKQINPADTTGLFWKPYLELAYARLAALTAFLESKTSAPKRQADSIGDLIALNLRAAFYEPPTRERDVQNTIETILRAHGLDFQREVVAIEFSTKKFVPDFTFETLDLALEVKLCDSSRKEKDIVDETTRT